jgi:hypothetical protein
MRNTAKSEEYHDWQHGGGGSCHVCIVFQFTYHDIEHMVLHRPYWETTIQDNTYKHELCVAEGEGTALYEYKIDVVSDGAYQVLSVYIYLLIDIPVLCQDCRVQGWCETGACADL